MRKFTLQSLLLIFLLSLGSYGISRGQAILYEDFNYTPPANIGGNGNAGSSSNNWTTHSVTSGQTTTIDVVNGNLSYPGLIAPNGYKVSMFGNGNLTSRDVNRAFTSTSNVLYFSVLLNVVDNSGITTTGDYFMHFGATAGTSVTVFGARLGAKQVNSGANYRFIIQNTSGGSPNFTEFAQDLSFGTTYLVVVKYNKSASPTMATLWVNPGNLGGSEPTGGVTNSSGTSTFSTFASICLRNNATTPKVEIDEIRIGTNWADVTPAGAAPSISATPTSLTGFFYNLGSGPSPSQSYNLSGSNLTPSAGNVTITPSANFEVSLNNSTFFSTPVTQGYTGGTLAAIPVYVRLKAGLALGNYNLENIVNSGGGATAVNVACSGSVVKPEPSNHVTAFAAATAVPSYSTINTTWTDATGGTLPDAYLVKAATGGYTFITDPVDGTPEPDALLVKNISQGVQTAAFTGLTDNTQYYFKIYPYTNSGTAINYKTSVTVPQATATTTLSPSITYTWIGADGAAWNVAANWSPVRTTPNVNDILIFNGGGIKTVTAVPTETVGKIALSGNTTINLQSNAAAVLSISGVTGADLDIPAGCALNLNAINAITISLLTSATASISGNITFSSTANTAHRLIAADPNAITFNAGANFTAGLYFQGNAFGTTSLGSVIFASGSTYNQQAGSNPFGASQPNSVVVFQTGSLYKVIANASPAFSGRNYANFELDAGSVTITTTGASAVTMDNLTITNGTLNFNMTGTPGHSIKGNIYVASGGTLNFNPSSAGTVALNGITEQSISGPGLITTGTNSTFDISNVAGVSLGTSIAMNGKLKLTSGLLVLGSSDLLLGTASVILGTPSSTNMIVATGSGQLQKKFANGFTGSFEFPVGDNNPPAEYSPVTLNFISGTFGTGSYAGVNLVNAKYPDDPNTGNYLNRYWAVTQNGITGFNCNATFQYLPEDVHGTESQIYCLKVLPLPFTTFNIANTTLHQLSANSLNAFGTFTGSQPQLPQVITSPVIDVTYNSATAGGDVTSDGGSAISARGVCYATTHNPSLTGPHTTETGGTGAFTSVLTGLMPQTTYYVRAYVTNMVGTTYGGELSFTTLCEPYPPEIDFYADHININVGDSINFFDASLYCPTYWKWSFVGGEPYESFVQNPTWIHYNYPGVYTVCLDESNNYGYSSICKEAYITVTAPPVPSDAKLVITEIMYNPPESGVDTLEFIEVYNNDASPLNIKDFYFDKGVVYTFPDTTLQPYSYLIVSKSAAAMFNTFGTIVLQWIEGSLNNGGEPIVIYDNQGFLVDSVYFDDVPPWDTLADGWGPSLELCDPNSDNTNPLNWRAAIEFAAINPAGDSIWATPMTGCSNLPLANFEASDTAILQYQYVTFTDLSTPDVVNWFWTFEGGIPDAFEGKVPPPVQYPFMGAFDVSLTVVNVVGQNTLLKSEYIEVGPSGIPAPNLDEGIQIYPNPGEGPFTLQLNAHLVPSVVSIINQLGKVVFEVEIKQQTNIINPARLTPGIYFLRVMTENPGETKLSKLIIH